MRPWIQYAKTAPEGYQAVRGLETYVKQCGLERPLLELVRLRASQINGCAFCLDMHAKDARAEGESEQRIYLLSAWREAPLYSDRERAALAWTEAVTEISKNGLPDDVFENARAHFSEKELVDLTLAVIAINSWNRLAISFSTPPGSYQPQSPTAARGKPA